MLIVVMMGKWSDDSAVVQCVRYCGDIWRRCLLLCCVFSVMWSEWLMTSAICCPLWSSVYAHQRLECAFASPVRTECGMFVMYCMQCCMCLSVVL